MGMEIIEGSGYAGLRVDRGAGLRVVDLEGGQVVDLIAFGAEDTTEWLSGGRSIDRAGTLCFTTGDVLASNRYRPMWTIEADSVGQHDFLHPACSPEMYRHQYGSTGPQPNCQDNLRRALADLGLDPPEIPTPFNLFMNVEVGSDGTLTIHPPLSTEGDEVLLRAEMDLAVALSACPAPGCNAGGPGPPRPIGFELVESGT